MEYRCVATSVEGFVQQLAVAYITHGYWFYVAGTIPEVKDPAAVDAKLIARYGIAISKWARCRRKKQGLANMQYLRHERFFVLLATKGRHAFFERERASVRDVRRKSIKFAGYSIGCRKGRDGRWHAAVRIEHSEYDRLLAACDAIALRSTPLRNVNALGRSSAAHYAPIRNQLRSATRRVSNLRRRAGLPQLHFDAHRSSAATVRPFDSISAEAKSPRFATETTHEGQQETRTPARPP